MRFVKMLAALWPERAHRKKVRLKNEEVASMQYSSVEDYRFWSWIYDHDFG